MEEKKSAGFWAFIFKGFTVLIKSAKLLKFAFAAATFASYAYLFTWKFALMVLLAIGFHESGHVWAMKKTGLKTKGFYFIPFLGGAAIASEPHKTHADQAFVAIMGPVWGFVLASVTYVAYLVTGNPLFAAVASWMALVNLFNLLPVNPLDGGQLMRTITFSVHGTIGLIFLGLSIIAGAMAAFYFKIGLFAVLILAAALDFVGEIFTRRSNAKRMAELNEYRNKWGDEDWIMNEIDKVKSGEKTPMNKGQLALTAISYVGITVMLFVLMYKTQHVPGADLALGVLLDK